MQQDEGEGGVLDPAANPFPDMLYRVTAPHFVAGFTVAHDGTVTAAAPIIAWMFDKPLAYIRKYCQGKGWELEAVSTGSIILPTGHLPNA